MTIQIGPGISVGSGISFTDGGAPPPPPPPPPPSTPFTMYVEPGLVDGVDFTVTFPAAGSGNITINWGDGNTQSYSGNFGNSTPAPTHTYASDGNYTVTATGTLYGIQAFGEQRITGVTQWGNLNIQQLFNAFDNCINLTVVPNSLPTTLSDNSLHRVFAGCSSFNDSNVLAWNVSNITNVSAMFDSASTFDQDIGGWNVSNVVDAFNMFFNASAFDGNIGDWGNKTNNISNMGGMFYLASAFNQNLNTWYTNNVTDMSFMFDGATAFNQNIGGWNIINVTNMFSMFNGANAFNGNISNWNTINVTDMSDMFNNATIFNQDLSGWCVTNIVSEPINFSTNSALTSENKPDWGNCP